MRILVLNAGSSSVKAAIYDSPGAEVSAPAWSARATWSQVPGTATIKAGDRTTSVQIDDAPGVMEALVSLLAGQSIDAVGHRIVHGGNLYQEPVRITAEVRAGIARFAEFAPEHNRIEARAIDAVEARLGAAVPQYAVFDTAFHATMPEPAYIYPGPHSWLDQGLRRYGFHGISHRYASERAAKMLARTGLRTVTCHLGNGCSLAAVRSGKSIDTTMGFTPLDGLMMGSRSGSVDPGILIYLMRHGNCSADELDRILNEQSGLKGISGVSSDMREIIAAMDEGNQRARLAFDIYIHRLCREIGGMAASLGGIDGLVFTGGVGENAAQVRQRTCDQLAFLGIQLDKDLNANAKTDADLTAPDAHTRVLLIRAEEEWQIARECSFYLGK